MNRPAEPFPKRGDGRWVRSRIVLTRKSVVWRTRRRWRSDDPAGPWGPGWLIIALLVAALAILAGGAFVLWSRLGMQVPGELRVLLEWTLTWMERVTEWVLSLG